MIAVGTRVSYMDMANPLREGVIVGDVADQWLVRWDGEDAPYCAVHEQGDCPDGCPNAWAASVTKQMLERAAERQQTLAEGRVRVAGWNVLAAEELDYDVGSIVEYRTFGGGLRRIRVTARSANISDGVAGFDGVLLNMTDEPTGTTVWGYDEQIVRVAVKEAVRSGR